MSQRDVPVVGNTPIREINAATGNETYTLPVGYASNRSLFVRRVDGSAYTVTVSATGDEELNGVENGSISIPAREQVEFVGGDGAWIAVGFGGSEAAAATDAPGTDAWLKLHAGGDLDALLVGTITRDVNGAATAASVVWPDGTTGTYTATTVSVAFPGAVDAFTVTYAGSTTKTVTQPAVTRDGTTGAVTVRPAMTVS